MWTDMWHQLFVILPALLVVLAFKWVAPRVRSILSNVAIRWPWLSRARIWVKAIGASARRPMPLMFATAAFLPVALVSGWHFWKEVDLGSSSTAAISLLPVPIVAAVTAIPFALLGLSLGAFIQWRQQQDSTAAHLALVTGFLAVIVIGSGTAYWFNEQSHKTLVLDAYARLKIMDDAGLQTFMRDDPMGQDRILLGVIAMHPASSTETLAKIASLDRADLHEKYGEYKPQMMGNRKGLAVMRLVAMNPQTDSAILTTLAKSQNPYVLGTVAGNRLTPPDVIQRLYNQRDPSEGYLVSWGVASNPATPAPILRELVDQSCNEYVLRNLMVNEGAPEEIRLRATTRVKQGDYRANCFS